MRNKEYIEKLENIGFYTLSDERAKQTSLSSPMQRCEMILTNKCNFKCLYCRGLRKDCLKDMSLTKAKEVIDIWSDEGLVNIRFSGGEPTCYPYLPELIAYAQRKNIKRIAVSTNGYQDFEYYKKLIDLGVNDFSISLDACCSSFGDKMSGGIKGSWKKVVNTIKKLSKLTYVTIGMVFDSDNFHLAQQTIEFASKLGVSDIRIVSSAQLNKPIDNLNKITNKLLAKHPILKYRINHFLTGRNVRGIKSNDYHRCPLMLDDSVVAGNYHFPCIIYMREHGSPIGKISKNMRKERYKWFQEHDTYKDAICQKNCLDVCIDYNNKVKELNDFKN